MRNSKGGWLENKARKPPLLCDIFKVDKEGARVSSGTIAFCNARNASIILSRPANKAPPLSARYSRLLEKAATKILPKNVNRISNTIDSIKNIGPGPLIDPSLLLRPADPTEIT